MEGSLHGGQAPESSEATAQLGGDGSTGRPTRRLGKSSQSERPSGRPDDLVGIAANTRLSSGLARLWPGCRPKQRCVEQQGATPRTQEKAVPKSNPAPNL